MDSFNMDEDVLVSTTSKISMENNSTSKVTNLRKNDAAFTRYAKENRKTGKTLKINRIYKVLKVVGCLVLAGAVVTYGYQYFNKFRTDNQLPPQLDNCVFTEAKVYVSNDEKIPEIAEKYYYGNDQALYEQYYGTFDKYKKTVLETNENFKYYDKTLSGVYVDIPIIFSTDNQFYRKCIVIQEKIKEIEQTNYWVSYIVKSGDSCSRLASRASGNEAETKELELKIMRHNNLTSSNDLILGSTIETVNPELGNLKVELEETKNELFNYIQSNDQKEVKYQK